jgi:hypothetical protein
MFDQPSYNSLQDKTGSNGALKDAQYNLHCPANGGPEWKLNYFKSSCAIRLEDHTCKNKKCKRFKLANTGKSSTVIQGETKRPPTNKKHKCICCGKIGRYNGRGLIQKCYDRNKRAGTLDKFPKTRV